MEIITDMTLKTTKDGSSVTVISVDNKYRTAIVRSEDGSTRTYTFGTLKDKRRFIPVEKEAVFSTNEITGETFYHGFHEVPANDTDDSDDEYVAEIMQQKADLGIECPLIDPEKVAITDIIDTTGKEPDNDVTSKFVKKVQKIITFATYNSDGYHVSINFNGEKLSFSSNNLQHIRSDIGMLLRKEHTYYQCATRC